MENNLNITLDDLSGNQREIAEIIGVDAFVNLSRRYGGVVDLYIMKYSELQRISDRKQLLEDFDGHNYEELARKYDLCTGTIRNLIPPELRRERKAKPLDGQMTLE
mgnify:CR=1 FL=1